MNEENNNPKPEKNSPAIDVTKKTNKAVMFFKNKFVFGIIVVTFVIGGFYVGVNFNTWFGKPAASGNVLDLDGSASDWVDETPPVQGGTSSGIAIPGYPYIGMPPNTPNVKVALYNPKQNSCYFTFEIVLDNTEETIYKSKMVPPGKAIYNMSMTRGLTKGNHPATIKISTFKKDTLEPLNGADVKTVLKVG